MTDKPQIRGTIAWKTWIAIRFIILGVGGAIAVMISWLSLLFAFDPPGERLLSPLVAVMLGLVGALMMLYGGGQWGRWAYLWVFLSMPIAVLLALTVGSLIPEHLFERFDWLFAKPIVIIFFALPMPVSYLLVRGYYRRREVETTKAST